MMQIPCGIITDKIGTKTMIAISSIICALGTFMFGSAESLFQLEAGRFFIGLSSAPAFLCCGKVAADFFDKKKYAMLMGVAMGMGCLGGIAGSAPTAYFVSKFGWRVTTYFISFVGIMLAILAVVCMEKKKISSQVKIQLFSGLKIISKNPKIWILGLYGAMTYLPLTALAELWIIPFMEQRYEIQTETAAISSIIIFIGFALGGIISAWVAEKINSYKKTIISFTFGVLASFLFAIYSDSINFYTSLGILFICGICAGANTLAFAMVYHLTPSEFGGTSSGFMNALIMSSGLIFQPLLGKLLDFFRNELVDANGGAVYNLAMYRSALLFVGIGMLLAVIATFFLSDVKPKEES
jgi:MFS family permease